MRLLAGNVVVKGADNVVLLVFWGIERQPEKKCPKKITLRHSADIALKYRPFILRYCPC